MDWEESARANGLDLGRNEGWVGDGGPLVLTLILSLEVELELGVGAGDCGSGARGGLAPLKLPLLLDAESGPLATRLWSLSGRRAVAASGVKAGLGSDGTGGGAVHVWSPSSASGTGW